MLLKPPCIVGRHPPLHPQWLNREVRLLRAYCVQQAWYQLSWSDQLLHHWWSETTDWHSEVANTLNVLIAGIFILKHRSYARQMDNMPVWRLTECQSSCLMQENRASHSVKKKTGAKCTERLSVNTPKDTAPSSGKNFFFTGRGRIQKYSYRAYFSRLQRLIRFHFFLYMKNSQMPYASTFNLNLAHLSKKFWQTQVKLLTVQWTQTI